MRDFDHTAREPRPLMAALKKGWRRRCPSCGGGHLFDGYLSVRSSCDICGEDFHHHRADDAPAWLTMIIVGHLIAPVMLTAYQFLDVPTLAHAIFWPAVAMTGVVVLLPRVKGLVIGFQWSQRMHGFDEKFPDPD